MTACSAELAPPMQPDTAAAADLSANQRQIAVTAAHEINNVLTTIQLAAEFIGKTVRDDDVVRQVDSLRRCVQRGRAVTDEILGDHDPRSRASSVIDVRRWLTGATDDLKQRLPPHITLELRLGAGDLFLYGDEERLSEVLTNLALNGRDAMPAGGSLVISCEVCVSWERLRFTVSSPDRYVHIKVRDTGTGIPASLLHRIFDPLFTTKPDGRGAGLTLAKEVLEHHDGQIFAESTVGEGTVVHLFVPLAPNPAAEIRLLTGDHAPAEGERTQREEHRPAGSDAQLVLIIDDDVMVTEALAAGLAREGRVIVTCNDIESAQLVVERWHPSHVVSDVHMSGPFRFEGLEFIRYAETHSPESRLILMTGDAPDALQLEASERGAVAFLRKPFETAELDAILDLVSSSAPSFATSTPPVLAMPLLDEIVSSSALQSVFQPIVRLGADDSRFGYEALARYPSNSLLCDPQVLFDYALRKDRMADLEFACIARALEGARRLPASASLFLNVHPAVLTRSRSLRELLLREGAEFGLHRIVLEITEQGSFPDDPAIFDDLDRLRDAGVRLGFDDVGVSYSHLPFIDRAKPAFLKISQRFGTAFEGDPTKRKIVMNILTLARDFGCDLIIEGIEEHATAEAARDLGIPYGQGFLFARPSDASVFINDSIAQ